MQKLVIFKSKEKAYKLYFGKDISYNLAVLLSESGILKTKCLLITDSNVLALHAYKIYNLLKTCGYETYIFSFVAGEESKNLRTVEKIIEKCLEIGLTKNSFILSVGGGVVSDVAGFVASIYMRGIPYVIIPTTLIAHDSCLGGKVGVNTTFGKNLIGAFYQPKFVLYDLSFLTSLPKREYLAGFAEIIKHALIYDNAFFSWLKQHAEKLLCLDLDILHEALHKSFVIKSKIIENDEYDKNERRILNFGHTIGHALEIATNYSYNHGEAISIGMVLEAFISQNFFELANLYLEVLNIVKKFTLPFTLKNLKLSKEELLEIMLRDKKNTNGKYSFVLLKGIGKAVFVKEVKKDLILQALEKLDV